MRRRRDANEGDPGRPTEATLWEPGRRPATAPTRERAAAAVAAPPERREPPPRRPRTPARAAAFLAGGAIAIGVIAAGIAAVSVGSWTSGSRSFARIPLAEIPPGVSYHKVEGTPVFVSNWSPDFYPHAPAAGFLVAFLGRSTHLGEPIAWCASAEVFDSPAHGEKWDRYGAYLAGPAPRDLDRLDSEVDGSALVVHVDRVIEADGRSDGDRASLSGPLCFGTVVEGFYQS